MGRYNVNATNRDKELARREREYQKLKRIVDLGNKPPLSRAELIYFGKLPDPQYTDYLTAPRPASLDYTGMSMHPKTDKPPEVKAELPPAVPKDGPPLTKGELQEVFEATKAQALDLEKTAPAAEAHQVPEDETEISPGDRIGPFTWAKGGKISRGRVEKVITAADTYGTKTTQARNKLIVLLMADIGLGMDELRRIGPDTVNLDKGVFFSLAGDIPIRRVSRRTWRLLEGMVKLGQGVALDNATYYRLVRAITEAAGEKITAAQLIRSGKAHRAEHMRTKRGHATAIKRGEE